MASKKKPAKRKAKRPRLDLGRRIGSTLDVEHMAKTGHIRVDDLACEDCAVHAWWATYDGRTERIPGEPDRWFRARGDALVLFSERLGYAVSQDSIELVWSDRKPDPPPLTIDIACACVAVGTKEFFCSEHAEKKA